MASVGVGLVTGLTASASITDDMAKSVASSLVCSRLDYANSFLYGTTQKISIGSSASKTHLPESLPVTLSDKTRTHLVFLNIFTGCLLNNVYSSILLHLPITLCSTQPAYLHSLLNFHTPTCSLHSVNTNLLSV